MFNFDLNRIRNLGYLRGQYALLNSMREQLVRECEMVVHIGAHTGSEAEFYQSLQKRVVWVEANPQVADSLIQNISNFSNQIAFNLLLGDEDCPQVDFHVSSNQGQSSSLFDFGKDMNHKNLAMVKTIKLPMFKLDSVFSTEQILKNSHWIIDVQGAELKVLKGAAKMLSMASSLDIEISTREEYSGGATYYQVKTFLSSFGFYPLWRPKENSHEDIIFIRKL